MLPVAFFAYLIKFIKYSSDVRSVRCTGNLKAYCKSLLIHYRRIYGYFITKNPLYHDFCMFWCTCIVNPGDASNDSITHTDFEKSKIMP